MIPKLIHYSWFSGEPFPKHIEELMKTWKKVLPDYEFMLWDAKKLAEVNNTFANEAVSVGKWAFAADFIRLYAVYTYGGIWLDTDVEMFKSFNPYLKHKMFIGREWYTHNYSPQVCYLTSHCFGAEKGHPFLKDCLEYYKIRQFIRAKADCIPVDLKYDMRLLPEIQAKIALNYGYNWLESVDEHQILASDINVYPHDFFDAPGFSKMDNVVCIHRASGGWRDSGNGIPDYSFTNPHKKDIAYIADKILNGCLGQIGLQLIKISRK